ncbi:hypothetical protein [Janibacter sp. GXQ6167]|uniref:hypothetical protein n=1 Tax=Janibacter sp. GXQ6167 TaxID=3240791 RepID=UPI0035240B4A
MRSLTYPSREFPGPPGVSLDVPDTWAPVRLGGTLMSCRRAAGEDGFAPSIVVRGYQRGPDFTLVEAITELGDYVRGQNGGTIDPPFDLERAGTMLRGVNASWQDPVVGQVVQVHLFASSRRGPIVDLIQVTGSVGGADAPAAYAEVRSILTTLRITA